MKNKAWVTLSEQEYEAIWDDVYTALGFKPSVYEKDFPGFWEPSPSKTYSCEAIWNDEFEILSKDLQDKLQSAFKRLSASDEFLYALDWQHEGFRFYPSKIVETENPDWPISVYPDGEYCIFLEPSLEYGILGHPWEKTICVFGRSLLTELSLDEPKIFKKPIRWKT